MSVVLMASAIGLHEDAYKQGAGERWVPQKHLGAGGQGQAGLWVKVNEQQRIIDRMVIKESRHGDSWDLRGGFVNGVPREAYCQRLLTVPNSYTVHHRGWANYERKKVWRLYMEFCPYGTLRDTVNDPDI